MSSSMKFASASMLTCALMLGPAACERNAPPPQSPLDTTFVQMRPAAANYVITSAYVRNDVPAAMPIHHFETHPLRAHYQLELPIFDPASIRQWADRYPEAARELGEWMRRWPEMSAKLVDVDTRYTGRIEALTIWATSHPYDPLGSFFLTRAGWDSIDIQKGTREFDALNHYLQWARRCPHAAAALVEHPGGLAWAASNVYGLRPTREALR